MEHWYQEMVLSPLASPPTRLGKRWEVFAVTSLADSFALCVCDGWWMGWLAQVLKIQEENVHRLSLLSEKEIMEEQRRIRDALGTMLLVNGKSEYILFFSTKGPNLTAFLLAKKKQPFKAISTGPEGGAVASVTDGEEKAIVGGSDREETNSSGHKWLNMDVVERDKMEWMTDVMMENVTFTQVRENFVCMFVHVCV